ncbi:HET domain-containing protein [Fusarium sp. LHS14.1]|nr:HET domain-containing protein [Fusarium sp. LHS14.1]
MSEVDQSRCTAHQLYSPLPAGIWTRILVLEPGDVGGPISCSLHAARFDSECEIPLYDAISYVWGSTGDTRSIYCQGHPVNITVNLFQALRQMRHPRESRRIWADALCINQLDLLEKSVQVNMMGDIYAHARQVVVCLGDDGQNGEAADIAFSAIRDFNRVAAKYLSEDTLRSGKWWKPDDGYGPVTAARLQNVAPIFSHPWFERVWVLQEVGLAKKAVLAYGFSTIDFAEAMDFVQARARTASSLPGPSFRPGLISSLFTYILSSYVKDVENSWFRSSRVLKVLAQQSLKTGRIDFEDVLFGARQTQKGTDDRDFVYAFLGHPFARSEDGELLVRADYTGSMSELRLSLFSRLSTRSLRFLGLLWHCTPEELTSGPSWCPQLDAHRAANINGRYEAFRGEDLTSGGEFSPRVDGSSLKVCVYLVDTTDFLEQVVLEEPRDSEKATIDDRKTSYLAMESISPERPSIVETYWSLLEESENCHGLAYEDKGFAFASTLLGALEGEDAPSIARSFAQFCREHCPSIHSYLEECRWLQGWSSREPTRKISFQQRAANVMRGQRFFTSAKGYW